MVIFIVDAKKEVPEPSTNTIARHQYINFRCRFNLKF